MELKVDYLTLSIIPSEIVEPNSFYLDLLHFFGLTKFLNSFKRCGGGAFYNYIMRYRDISFKIPDGFNSDVQGFCIEFTGQGIDFYIDYMRRSYPDYSVKDLLIAFFALADKGFKVRVTRIDIAYDDISYEEKKYYLLDLDRIRRALVNLEFTSRFSLKSKMKKMEVTFEESGKGKATDSVFCGSTIYIGNRRSKTFCRFYDKLAELFKHGKDIDENIKHWTRLEFEFKDRRAMSICMLLITLSDSDFVTQMSEVVNSYICFVVTKSEKNATNYSRCPVKRWWAKAIGTMSKSRLVCRKPEKNNYAAAVNWVRRSVSPTLYSILQCMSFDKFLSMLKEDGEQRQSLHHNLIIEDFINDRPDEVLEGLDEFSLYTDRYNDFLKSLRQEQYKNEVRYLSHYYADKQDAVGMQADDAFFRSQFFDPEYIKSIADSCQLGILENFA